MAGKRAGRARRDRAGGIEPHDTVRAASPAQVERALTALEELVLAGRAEEIPRWTAVLWSNRTETQRALLRRLESGPVRVPGLYFDVLSGLGGSRAQVLMRRVAANREVPDLLRMEARRRAGWPERTEARARAAFLRTLRDPAAALGNLVAMGCGLPVPDGEAFGETLGYLLAMPADDRAILAARIAGDYGPAITWLLRALLAAPDAPTRRLALEELLGMRDRGAIAALDRLARSDPDGEGRETALVAARRLSLHVVPTGPPADGGSPVRGHAPRPRTPLPPLQSGVTPRRPPTGAQAKDGDFLPFERAVITAIDGNGGQAITLIRSWDPELRLVVQVFLRDEVGILDAYGMMRVPRDQTEEMLRLFGDRDCPLVGVSLQEARQTVLWAAERSVTDGRLPPPAFALWEPYFFEDLCPAAPQQPPAAPRLDGGMASPAGERVADLLASPFCESWHFSADDLAPVLQRLTDAGAPGRTRYAVLLSQLCPPPVRLLLAGRLRRQAWLLDRSGRLDLRDAALGSAVGLETLDAPELADLPILRGMLARGLAALRAPTGAGQSPDADPTEDD